MAILIDLSKYRAGPDNNETPAEAVFYPVPNRNGLRTLRELAVFRFTCRKCEDAPCIQVCPAKALEKDSEGLVARAVNLCISCKSCVVICPFGTMMTDFFRFRNDRTKLFDLTDSNQVTQFLKNSPEGAVTLTDRDENPDENIYRLEGNILIKEFMWDSEKL